MFTKIPLKYRYSFLRKIFKPDIFEEAFFAYYHRLPGNISVDWERHDAFIVGKVSAGTKEFTTQGRNADDFVAVVNESIFTVFDIPYKYFDVMKKARFYHPSKDQYKELTNKDVQASRLDVVKKKNEEFAFA